MYLIGSIERISVPQYNSITYLNFLVIKPISMYGEDIYLQY